MFFLVVLYYKSCCVIFLEKRKLIFRNEFFPLPQILPHNITKGPSVLCLNIFYLITLVTTGRTSTHVFNYVSLYINGKNKLINKFIKSCIFC